MRVGALAGAALQGADGRGGELRALGQLLLAERGPHPVTLQQLAKRRRSGRHGSDRAAPNLTDTHSAAQGSGARFSYEFSLATNSTPKLADSKATRAP